MYVYISSSSKIIVSSESERIWKGAVVAYLRYYTDTCPKGPRKFTKNLRIFRVPAEIRTDILPGNSLPMLTLQKLCIFSA
jgi:hypothetical protein